MSDKNEWNDSETFLEANEAFKNSSPMVKQLFVQSLISLLQEEMKKPKVCDCECHTDPYMMHMAPCC